LARKHNTTVEKIASDNKIQDPNKINVGQKINIGDVKVKPKTEVKPKTTGTNCPYGKLCTAIQSAETGSEKDPFIRTRHRPKGGSTAYGPGQITGQTLRDFKNRHPNEFNDVGDYMDNLISQSKKFAKYGAEPKKPGYHKRYDYGGSGELSNKNSELYNKVQRGVVRGMAKDLFGSIPDTLTPKQRERLVTRYRGADRKSDPRYFGVIDKSYK